jgi:uncharacterized protein
MAGLATLQPAGYRDPRPEMDPNELARAWRRRLEAEAAQIHAAAEGARARAEEAASVLRDDFGAREVWLFGSLVGGQPRHANFDVDLAVVGIPPARHFKALARAAEIIGRPVDLVALESASEALARRIRERGVHLHGR